jgi:hypothetical protein
MVTDLLHWDKSLTTLTAVLERVDAYLEERVLQIFKPLLDFLSSLGDLCGILEIFRHFASRLRLREEDLRLFDACRWLAEIGILGVVKKTCQTDNTQPDYCR